MSKQIRVLIVDDSALMRQMLSELLSRNGDITVVGAACDAYEAREMIKTLHPQVVTLDVEMPRMDGISFLEKIMTLRPMPVVMASSLTQEGSDAAVRALELGAVDCVAKPDGADAHGMERMADELAEKIRIAAAVRLPPPRTSAPSGAAGGKIKARGVAHSRRFIALGASTGGVERIRDILTALPPDCPPMVITQHMGAHYVPSFAARLDTLSAPQVGMATDGARLAQGVVYIAPGDRHLAVARDNRGFFCRVLDTPPVSGHRPSVDVMFQSVADAAGAAAVGVILSGMGRDGAAGMAAMRRAGCHTIGEQESSCVVYGMPRAAKDAGGITVELPISQIAAEMLRAAETPADGQAGR